MNGKIRSCSLPTSLSHFSPPSLFEHMSHIRFVVICTWNDMRFGLKIGRYRLFLWKQKCPFYFYRRTCVFAEYTYTSKDKTKVFLNLTLLWDTLFVLTMSTIIYQRINHKSLNLNLNIHRNQKPINENNILYCRWFLFENGNTFQ